MIQVRLPSGQTVWANVAGGPADVGATDAIKDLPVEELRDTIEGVSQSVVEAVEGAFPDEVSVEFGLELAVKTGKLVSVLAEASGKASLKVTLTWNSSGRRKSSAPADDEDAPHAAEPD
jgi:hypothetical protein